MVMALNQCHYGQLHAAAGSFQSIIDLGIRARLTPADEAGSPLFFPAGQGYIGLASIELEWNHLEAAEGHLKQGMELCRQGGLDGVFLGRVLTSRLLQAKGDLEGALEEIRSARQSFQRADQFTIATRQTQISLAQGDVEGASRVAAPLEEMIGGDAATGRLPLLLSEVVQAILVRVYLAQGETGRALRLLNQLETTAEPARRFGRLIEAGLLRALALQQQTPGSVSSEAIGSLERALDLAEPERYALLFLEEGPALIPLLLGVVNRASAPVRVKKYAQMLLDAFRRLGHPGSPRSPGGAPGLVEPLTPREMEVLRLLAAGASNQTIAERLVITVRTVKKHTGNIYGKLGAGSRTQAVARARELGLLSSD
jgi:LuxR family maltose regulon positive regulatory protein